MENQSKKMVQIVYDALDEKLGEDIEILKVDEISVIADYLVIANGRNQNQLNAMTDLVEEKMIEAGYKSKRIEGNKNSSVVLTDGDFLICYPNDGHRTAVQAGDKPETIKKAIFKVRI